MESAAVRKTVMAYALHPPARLEPRCYGFTSRPTRSKPLLLHAMPYAQRMRGLNLRSSPNARHVQESQMYAPRAFTLASANAVTSNGTQTLLFVQIVTDACVRNVRKKPKP